MTKMTTGGRSQLMPVNPSAAVTAIGPTMHLAAANPDCTDTPIRAFGAFNHDLHDLARWFKSCGVGSVAMESTGVYWIPAFEIEHNTTEAKPFVCAPTPTISSPPETEGSKCRIQSARCWATAPTCPAMLTECPSE